MDDILTFQQTLKLELLVLINLQNKKYVKNYN